MCCVCSKRLFLIFCHFKNVSQKALISTFDFFFQVFQSIGRTGVNMRANVQK